MNCWKSLSITKELGSSRIYILSTLIGMIAFLILYLSYAMYHQTNEVKDYGLLPVLLGVFLLPAVHRLMHIIPLILCYKRVKIKWHFKKRLFPTFSYRTKSTLSKKTSVLMALTPTLLLTVPGLVTAFVFPDAFAYIIVLTSINIGLSFTDFVYVKQFLRAPNNCIIENVNDGFDILIKRYRD